jgi:hypothetical protein
MTGFIVRLRNNDTVDVVPGAFFAAGILPAQGVKQLFTAPDAAEGKFAENGLFFSKMPFFSMPFRESPKRFRGPPKRFRESPK